MGAVLRNSTLYANLFVNKYPGDARDHGGRVFPLPFELTVVSVSTVADTYNLTVIPAFAQVHSGFAITDGLGASAGAGRTFAAGDSGDADRYFVATDFDVTGAAAHLAVTGVRYRPTADAIVVAVSAGGAWVVGKQVKGFLEVLPPA